MSSRPGIRDPRSPETPPPAPALEPAEDAGHSAAEVDNAGVRGHTSRVEQRVGFGHVDGSLVDQVLDLGGAVA
jgi:hypothetical protein